MIHAELAEFFPTPRDVIHKLIAPVYDRLMKAETTLLEPSAGKGDILDLIAAQRHGQTCARLYAMELRREFRYILAQKGYDVIGDDFLAPFPARHIDVVIMNPPFSNGDEHLLKAWEIVAAGGVVVCLLNAETVNNPYTARRQQLKTILDQYGTVTALGACFKHAARPTDAEIVLVVLKKPAQTENLFDGLKFERARMESEGAFTTAELANTNLFAALVAQHDAAARALIERHRLSQAIAHYTRAVYTPGHSPTFPYDGLNTELDRLRDLFWAFIFDRTRIAAWTTTKVRKQFEQQRAVSMRLAFTLDNLIALLETLKENQVEIMKQCVVEVFDKITALHEKNTLHREGWKTNKSWMVARKIIVPKGVSYEPKFDSWSTCTYDQSFFEDLDKACCFLDGKPYDTLRQYHDLGSSKWIVPEFCTISDAIYRHVRENALNWDQPFDSGFFTIRIYKKGTVHLVFKDPSLWQRFNQAAADGKCWVGPGY
jgi:hypothetical protein